MADTEVGGLVVQIKAKADNLVNGLKQANTSITGFQSNFIKSFGAIAAIGAASFAAVGFAIKQTVDAAAEAEAAQNDLAIALRNAGDGSQAALQSSLDYSAALQRQTGISDELITATQTELVQYGLTGEALKIATQATLDLSTAKKMSLSAAADQVGKAFIGETGRLKQLGIVIDESVPKADRFRMAVEQMNDKFGGAAQGQLDTYKGNVNLLKEGFGEIVESIGGLFLPMMTDVVSAMAKGSLAVADFFQNNVSPGIDKIKDIAGNLLILKDGVMVLVGALADLIGKFQAVNSLWEDTKTVMGFLKDKVVEGTDALAASGRAAIQAAEQTKMADTAVAQNKTLQEQIRAQQMANIKNMEAVSDVAREADKQAQLAEIAKESEKFTADMQKAALERDNKNRALVEKAESEHKATLNRIADESETLMTSIFNRELDNRQKKQQIFSQVMRLLQTQVTQAFIASQATQASTAIKTSAVEVAAAKPAIAAGFFKAHAGIPIVGKAIALGLIAAAFSFIGSLVKFNTGGEVGGRGNSDTVPAMLTPGERVLNAGQNEMFNAVANAAMAGIGGGGGGNITINISGTFLEGSESKWQEMIRRKLIPEVRRITQSIPTGPFNRLRGAP